MIFKKITKDNIYEIDKYNHNQINRLCEFTLGVTIMWAEYYKSEYCIEEETYVMKNVTPDGVVTFSYPLGKNPKSMFEKIKKYALNNYGYFSLSPLGEEEINQLVKEYNGHKREIVEWFDYLYLYDDLAFFKGKKYGAKRNHINRFLEEYPNVRIKEISNDDIDKIKDFVINHLKKEVSSEYEAMLNIEILNDYSFYHFLGIVMYIDDNVVGFTIGEVKYDTLHVHIEKAERELNNYAYLCSSFVKYCKDKNPCIKYINRQDDTGDMGLRQSKLSYHPIQLLKKYEFVIKE